MVDLDIVNNGAYQNYLAHNSIYTLIEAMPIEFVWANLSVCIEYDDLYIKMFTWKHLQCRDRLYDQASVYIENGHHEPSAVLLPWTVSMNGYSKNNIFQCRKAALKNAEWLCLINELDFKPNKGEKNGI